MSRLVYGDELAAREPEAGDVTFAYHTDGDGLVFICAECQWSVTVPSAAPLRMIESILAAHAEAHPTR
jgi:hypothetical protein